MIPIIGLVICAYVTIRMCEIVASHETPLWLKCLGGIVLLGSVAAAVLLFSAVNDLEHALTLPGRGGTGDGGYGGYGDTTVVTPATESAEGRL